MEDKKDIKPKAPIPQEPLSLNQWMATDLWAMNNGLLTESIQQNLLAYGYLSHKNVLNVTLNFAPDFYIKKEIGFTITLSTFDAKKYRRYIKKFNKYTNANSLYGKWRQLQLLRKSSSIHIERNLKSFLNSYLPGYKPVITIEERRIVSKWILKLLGIGR